MTKLGEVADLITDKVDVRQIDMLSYITTENMITDRGGVCAAKNTPRVGAVTKYKSGDVLVSNIRPYFKKIWLANKCGGASNDVLVFRAKEAVVCSRYLYYALANDKFFNYVMASAKGAKMPRGDKAQILKYKIDLPDLATQKKISDTLSAFDDKIELNRQMNETLEEMGRALFRHYFIDNPEAKNWPMVKVGDVLQSLESGSRPRGGAIESGIPSIGAENVIGLGKYDYSKEKYISISFFEKLKRGVIQSGDVLLYKDGAYVGKKTMFMNGFPHERAAVNEHVFILRTNSKLPSQQYLYYWLDQDWITQKIVGAGIAKAAQPGINQRDVADLPIVLPPTSVVNEFNDICELLFGELFANALESRVLVKTRDFLASKLLN